MPLFLFYFTFAKEVEVLYFCFVLKIYLFYRERKKAHTSRRDWGREKESQVNSTLSVERNTGAGCQDTEIMTWAEIKS